MCLLSVFPMPDLMTSSAMQHLFNGTDCNPDGFGWAVVVGSSVVVGKSMSADDAIADFVDTYGYATGPALFHSRYATHGAKDEDNVHPFPVRKMGNTFLAHNGVMPKEAWPDANDPRSDTRVFADDFLPLRWKRLDSPKVREHLDTWLGGNKIAVITTNPKLRRQLYIIGMDRGMWVDGIWHSNSDYKGYSQYFSSGYGTGWGRNGSESALGEDDAPEQCSYCHQFTVNKYDVCDTCQTCQDCLEPWRDCQCYTSGTILGPSTATTTTVSKVTWDEVEM